LSPAKQQPGLEAIAGHEGALVATLDVREDVTPTAVVIPTLVLPSARDCRLTEGKRGGKLMEGKRCVMLMGGKRGVILIGGKRGDMLKGGKLGKTTAEVRLGWGNIDIAVSSVVGNTGVGIDRVGIEALGKVNPGNDTEGKLGVRMPLTTPGRIVVSGLGGGESDGSEKEGTLGERKPLITPGRIVVSGFGGGEKVGRLGDRMPLITSPRIV
jgi:hypothetical protein